MCTISAQRPRLNRFRHSELKGSRGLLHHLTFEIGDAVGQVQRIDICVVHFLALGADQIARFTVSGSTAAMCCAVRVAVKMTSPAAAVIGTNILVGSFLLPPGQKLYTLPQSDARCIGLTRRQQDADYQEKETSRCDPDVRQFRLDQESLV